MSNEGKHVSVHYVGTFDNGKVFDSSRPRHEPLEFECMAGQMIRGFDEAVRDMQVGEIKTIHLEPADAYGDYDPDLRLTVGISTLPGSEDLRVGEHITLESSEGYARPAVVLEKTKDTITFDMNHEMAGKPLNFEIELLEVKE